MYTRELLMENPKEGICRDLIFRIMSHNIEGGIELLLTPDSKVYILKNEITINDILDSEVASETLVMHSIKEISKAVWSEILLLWDVELDDYKREKKSEEFKIQHSMYAERLRRQLSDTELELMSVRIEGTKKDREILKLRNRVAELCKEVNTYKDKCNTKDKAMQEISNIISGEKNSSGAKDNSILYADAGSSGVVDIVKTLFKLGGFI